MNGMMEMLMQEEGVKAAQEEHYQEYSEEDDLSGKPHSSMEELPSTFNTSGEDNERNIQAAGNSDDTSTSYAMPGMSAELVPSAENAEHQAKQRHTAKMQKRAATEKRCKCCGTQNTPVWRWGGDAKDTLLCNACSLRIRRSNARPQSRSKLSGDRPSKKQSPVLLQGPKEPSNGAGTLSQEEIDALRKRLAGFMTQEKARLLRMAEAPPAEIDPDHSWEIPSDFMALDVNHPSQYHMGSPVQPVMHSPQGPQGWHPSGEAPYVYMRDVRPRQWGPYPEERPQGLQPPLPEEQHWDHQHHLHDQEMAFMYAQTTM